MTNTINYMQKLLINCNINLLYNCSIHLKNLEN